MSDRVLSRKEVAGRLDISVTTLWRMVRRDELPRPIAISCGRVGWRESTFERWLDVREAIASGQQ